MIILVNPRAGAGSGFARWQRIEPLIRAQFDGVKVVVTSDPDRLRAVVREAAESDDPRIVAAGGDGTANAAVNAILQLDLPGRDRCVLGAIGLGSSNDFHKPFVDRRMMDRFPTRLAFEGARLCDVGRVSYSVNRDGGEQYFFLNASAGITAEGNARFNAPGPLLNMLKRTHVSAAISYAAISALMAYRNQPVRLTIPPLGSLSIAMTNLGILKSPHFSGELHYDAEMNYENGRFVVVACSDMNIPQRYALFRALKDGSLSGLEHVHTWSTPVVDVESESPIVIELDGEIIITQKAHFEVRPRMVKVCP